MRQVRSLPTIPKPPLPPIENHSNPNPAPGKGPGEAWPLQGARVQQNIIPPPRGAPPSARPNAGARDAIGKFPSPPSRQPSKYAVVVEEDSTNADSVPAPSPIPKASERGSKPTWFFKRSALEHFENELSKLVHEHMLKKARVEEEIRAAVSSRNPRIQKVEEKNEASQLKIRLQRDSEIGELVHSYRRRLGQIEIEYTKKTTKQESTMQKWLAKIEKRAALGGWERALDHDSGSSYWINRETGESSWERPVAAKAALGVAKIGSGFDEEEMTCSICLDYFHGHVLQCANGHLFCEECLQEHVRVNGGHGESGPCPVCRVPVSPSNAVRNLLAERVAALARAREREEELEGDGNEPLTVDEVFAANHDAHEKLRLEWVSKKEIEKAPRATA